ncbi:DNRLRE domain-containing protein [candidate division KSB1 bacterium]|nr:DNRLRE domain-containing protein [candidate division KSB1 bacterium]
MKRISALCIVIPIFLFLFCSNEKPLPGGFESMPRDDKGEMLTLNAPLIQSGQFWAPHNAGSAPYLLLGDYDGIQSRIALLFTSLSAIDTATVEQAKLILNQIACFGAGADFAGTVHPITATWSETTVEWQDIQFNYDNSKAFPYSISAQDSSTITVDLEAGLVNNWVNGTDNYGLLMTFNQAGFMAKCNASENLSGYATLEVIYTSKTSGLDTVTVGVDQDAGLFEYSTAIPAYQMQENPDQLTIANGSGDRFLLRFDLSALPVEATVHRALLNFNIEAQGSRTDSAGVSLTVRQVATDSAWQDLSAMKLDSIYSSPSFVASQEASILYISQTPDVGYMGSMTQRWVLQLQPNYGILVQSLQYGQDMEKVIFNGAAASEGRRPTLYITYSMPPSPRF